MQIEMMFCTIITYLWYDFVDIVVVADDDGWLVVLRV